MEQDYFKILFKGEIIDGYDLQNVKQQIAKIFKLDSTTLNKLFSKKLIIVKKNVTYQTALKYKNTFIRTGAKCYLKKIKSESQNLSEKPEFSQLKNLQASSGIVNKEWDFSDQSIWNNAITKIRTKSQDTVLDDNITKTNKTPEIEVKNFSIFSLIGINLYVNFLISILLGFFIAPRIYFDFLAGHLKINNAQLKFEGLWTLIISLSIFLISLFLLSIPLNLLLKLIQYSYIFLFIYYILITLLFPFPVGIGLVILIQSLLKNTTLDGKHVCSTLFKSDLRDLIDYIFNNYLKIYFWGIGTILGLFISPFLMNIVLEEWYSHIEIDGYKFVVKAPWHEIVPDVFKIIFTLGLYNLFYIKHFFDDILPNGYWEPV